MSVTEERSIELKTETAFAGPSNYLLAPLRNALPLVGIGVPVILNAAWIAFLGYWVLQLVV
jgi:hypothetical protein